MAPPLSDGLKRSHANGYHFGRIVKSNVVRASTLSLIGTTVFLLALGFVERESVFQWTREHSFDDRIERKSQTADSDCVTRQEPQQTVRRFTPLSQLPQCARDNGRAASFLIVFMGHSGSTALITALQQHKQVNVTSMEPLDHKDMQFNTSRALAYADKFFTDTRRMNKTGGFKVRPFHITQAPEQWVTLIRKHGTRIIWNYRKNLLKQAIGHYPIVYMSSQAAYEGIPVPKKGDKFASNSLIPDQSKAISRIRIDNMTGLSQILSDRITGEARVEHALRRMGRAGRNLEECTLPISYESILADAEASVARAQLFLGLSMTEIHSPLRTKATEDNLCELVENHAEVCNAFYGCTHLRWMLDDIENDCLCNKLATADSFISRKYCPKDTFSS